MARWSIAMLVVLNLALAAWNFGAFARWGWKPQDGREPERLAQQVRPQAITVHPPVGAAAETAAAAASEALPPASTPSTRP